MKNTLRIVQEFPIKKEAPLSKLIQKNRIDVKMPCGKGKCGKCLVYAEGHINEPTKEEEKCLSKKELKEGLRLACQVEVKGDVALRLPQ